VSKRPGRRAGESRTREAITEAARRQFAQRGFDRTSLRSVAQEAGVDPTLVSHFFGSKQELFVKVVELPFDPAAVLPGVVAGDRDEIGLRLARFILAVLESDEGRQRFTGLMRAAASEEAAARLLREIVTHRILGTIAEHLGADDAAFRASLAGSQVVGLVMARYVVGVEPLASRPADEVAETVAPVLQHYLTEPL
jgi:AcrR family transcriptional regulator